jgi:hypothetical protein
VARARRDAPRWETTSPFRGNDLALWPPTKDPPSPQRPRSPPAPETPPPNVPIVRGGTKPAVEVGKNRPPSGGPPRVPSPAPGPVSLSIFPAPPRREGTGPRGRVEVVGAPWERQLADRQACIPPPRAGKTPLGKELPIRRVRVPPNPSMFLGWGPVGPPPNPFTEKRGKRSSAPVLSSQRGTPQCSPLLALPPCPVTRSNPKSYGREPESPWRLQPLQAGGEDVRNDPAFQLAQERGPPPTALAPEMRPRKGLRAKTPPHETNFEEKWKHQRVHPPPPFHPDPSTYPVGTSPPPTPPAELSGNSCTCLSPPRVVGGDRPQILNIMPPGSIRDRSGPRGRSGPKKSRKALGGPSAGAKILGKVFRAGGPCREPALPYLFRVLLPAGGGARFPFMRLSGPTLASTVRAPGRLWPPPPFPQAFSPN